MVLMTLELQVFWSLIMDLCGEKKNNLSLCWSSQISISHIFD